MPIRNVDPAWLLRFIQETAEVTWILGPDGYVFDVPQWVRLTGQTAEEMQGFGWLDVIHPEDRARVKGAWEAALSHAMHFNTDYRLRCADGIYRWVNARGVAILAPDGAITAWVGVILMVPGVHRTMVEKTPLADPDHEQSSLTDISPEGLRSVRAILGLSANEFAKKVGVSLSTIRRLEQVAHEVRARPANVSKILEFLVTQDIRLISNGSTIVGAALPGAQTEAQSAKSWLDLPTDPTLQ